MTKDMSKPDGQQPLVERTLRIEATFDVVSQSVQPILEDIFRAGICSPDTISNSEIVLAEVLNNIVEHGYAEAEGQIEITSGLTEDQIFFKIHDTGCPMPDLKVPSTNCPDYEVPLDELPEGGFGWFLIRTLVSDLEYHRSETGNHLRFTLARHV